MEQSIWNDFLMKQAPTIVVLGLFCYGMYKFFTAQQDKKDQLIATKDTELREQTKEVKDLYGKSIETNTKTNIILEQLLDIQKEIKSEINKP